MTTSIAGWVRSAVRRSITIYEGAVSIEYAVIAALLSVAIVTAVGILGGTVADLYNRVLEAFG